MDPAEPSRPTRIRLIGSPFIPPRAYQWRSHALLEHGHDAAVAYVETYGRRHTVELMHGLELLHQKRVKYRSATLEDMDLDAVLERRPEVALVDELAHTNAAGRPFCGDETGLDSLAAVTREFDGEFHYLRGEALTSTLASFIRESVAAGVIIVHRRTGWRPWDATSQLIRLLHGVDIHVLHR